MKAPQDCMFLHLHFFVSVEFAGNVADLAWQITFHIFKYSYIFVVAIATLEVIMCYLTVN